MRCCSDGAIRSLRGVLPRDGCGGCREIVVRRGNHALAHIVERAGDEGSRRLRVPATTELPRECVDVHFTGAPKRNLHLAIPEVAEEERHARARDGARVLDDAVEILLAYVVLLERARVHREPGESDGLVNTER